MRILEATQYETAQIIARMQAEEGITNMAVQRYWISTEEIPGQVVVRAETNDNNDDGYPDGEWVAWENTFPDVKSALKHTGVCRVGVSGVVVTVNMDGKEIR
jgi:hypothetical protein